MGTPPLGISALSTAVGIALGVQFPGVFQSLLVAPVHVNVIGGTMVKVNSLTPPNPVPALVTFTSMMKVPDCEGVPVNVPFDNRAIPVGSGPKNKEKEYGALPLIPDKDVE